jgi:hypothetical protein
MATQSRDNGRNSKMTVARSAARHEFTKAAAEMPAAFVVFAALIMWVRVARVAFAT